MLSYTGVSPERGRSASCGPRAEDAGRPGLLAPARTLHRAALGGRHRAGLGADGDGGLRRQPAAQDRRPRAGAPELRPNSRYNLDNAYITSRYTLSSDQFAVIVKTPAEGCVNYETLVEADRLAWTLQQLPGVQATTSLADAMRKITAGSFEGNSKWFTISPNQDILNYAARTASVTNPDCSTTIAR